MSPKTGRSGYNMLIVRKEYGKIQSFECGFSNRVYHFGSKMYAAT